MAPVGISRIGVGIETRKRSLLQGGGGQNAWQSDFFVGANVYSQAQYNGLIASGLPIKVLNIFQENAAGKEGWASNVIKSSQSLTNYSWARDAGLRFDIIVLTASPQEPMSQFSAGQWDTEYQQIIQNSVALAGPAATAILIPHNHEPDLRVQSDGHYAHSANQPGGNADYKANWARARSLNQAIDTRIKMGLVRIGNTSLYDPGWDWRDAMPPPETVDWYGADPYFIPRYDGADGARAAWAKLQGPNGLDEWMKYANGKPFSFREYGCSSNDVSFNEVLFDRLYVQPLVMYVNYFDQNPGGPSQAGLAFDTRFSSFLEQLAWFIKEFSPPVLDIPSTVAVAAGQQTRVRLRCTKNRIAWSMVANSNPGAVVMDADGKSLLVTLPSGSATVTVRASDAHKHSTDLTITISVAATNLYPVAAAGFECVVGPDGQPVFTDNDDFVYALAA